MVIKNLGFRLYKKSKVLRASSGLKDHQQVLDLKFQTCNLTPAQKFTKLKSPCLKQINSQSTSKMQDFSITIYILTIFYFYDLILDRYLYFL